MKILQSIASCEYNNEMGDDISVSLVHYQDDVYYPWVLLEFEDCNGEDNSDVFHDLDQFETWVHGFEPYGDPCEPSVHDEETDDYDHDECDCEHWRLSVKYEAYSYLLQQARQFEATGKIEGNLASVAVAVLNEQLNNAAHFPNARAVFSFDADRVTIRESVVRALEYADVGDDDIEQFRYEIDTSPDPLAVAREWVTCS